MSETSASSGEAGGPGGSVGGAPLQTRAQTLRQIARAPAGALLIIDFDETLLLHNSSQTYVRSARPYLLSALLLAVLERLQPWRLLPAGGRSHLLRDWFRVGLITLLFPWAVFFWRRNAARVAAEWGNRALIEALRARGDCRIVISSYGFSFLLRPVLEAMDLPTHELDACGLLSYGRDRLRGKPARLERLVGTGALETALLVTDSEDDDDLAARVGGTCHVRWDPPSPEPIFRHYVPLMYLVKAKYGNWNHIRSVIVADEFPLLVLCLSWLALYPLLHVAGLLCLLVSFWLIFEVGYMENDLAAERKEKAPQLSEKYRHNRDRIALVEPWAWALLLALPGVLLVRLAEPNGGGPAEWAFLPHPIDWGLFVEAGAYWTYVAYWAGLLVALRAVFWVYNRIDKFTRTWLYLPMQMAKNFGFAVVSPLGLFGFLVFLAHSLARWTTYFVYRYARQDYPGNNWFQRIRLFLLVFFALGALLLPGGLEAVLSWQALAITGWLLVRARPYVIESIRSIRGVSKDDWAPKG